MNYEEVRELFRREDRQIARVARMCSKRIVQAIFPLVMREVPKRGPHPFYRKRHKRMAGK
jgi:hypothetical protein